MSAESRQTFLYGLDANCNDFLPARADSKASDCMREHISYLKQLHVSQGLAQGTLYPFRVALQAPNPR